MRKYHTERFGMKYMACSGVTKLGNTKEERLMIDIMALRQSYQRRELTEF